MKFDNLKATLERNVGKYYPGADIVIHHEGKEVFRHQAGYSNLETKAPVNPDALYYIFSCSKPATCMAALQFFEKGYYRLTDPVYDFIPEFKDVVVRRTKPNGAVYYESPKTPVTVGQLFSMTSGIDYNFRTEAIEKVKEDTIQGVYVYFIAYVIVFVISVLLISLNNFDFATTFSSVLTTINNIGPGIAAVGPVENFANFSVFSKLVFCVDMLIGRLEIFPFIVLLSPNLWRKKF